MYKHGKKHNNEQEQKTEKSQFPPRKYAIIAKHAIHFQEKITEIALLKIHKKLIATKMKYLSNKKSLTNRQRNAIFPFLNNTLFVYVHAIDCNFYFDCTIHNKTQAVFLYSF